VGLPIVSDRCSAVASAAGAGFGRWFKWGTDLTGKRGGGNVAFKTVDDRIVIIVLNDSQSEEAFNIIVGDEAIHSSLSAGAVGTYVW
jgi:hypothetical protein